VAGRIAVVTDSTAYLPSGLPEKLAVTVVPLHVTVNGRSAVEGVEVFPADVARALAERRGAVSTSRALPSDFAAAFTSTLDDGAGGVVAVLMSGALSGTYESARLAARNFGTSVRIVDSRSAAMGLGFAVIAAAEAAREGDSLDDVYQAAVKTAQATSTLFYVDTLEHLRRGGRIGTAQALLGTALSVKPILTVADGAIVLREKVRTASRALARLEELTVELAGESIVDIAVHHLAAAEKAAALAGRLEQRLPAVRRMYRSEVGAAVGAHVGPGVLGVVIARR
jgi:fatty acid kinase fatty acid binding subunit